MISRIVFQILLIVNMFIIEPIHGMELTFDDVRNNKYVKGKIISTVQTGNVMYCLQQCMLSKSRCRSINIHRDREICELLEGSLSRNKYSTKVENKDGWLYYGETFKEEVSDKIHRGNMLSETAIRLLDVQQPYKDNKIHTIPIQYSTWRLQFSIMPLAKWYTWSNILHFTIGGNCVVIGDRFPAIWFRPNEFRLHITTALDNKKNYQHNTEAIPQYVYTRLDVQQHVYEGEAYYEIYINGTRVHRVKNQKPMNFKNVAVYIGDPWYEPAKCKIKDLEFTTENY